MFSSDRILTIRKSRGYSQEMLAEQSGVSLRTIQRVEQGDTVPRGHTLQALATALGVSLDDFRSPPETSSEPPAEVAAPPTEAVAMESVARPPTPESAWLPAPETLAAGTSSWQLSTAPALHPDSQFLQLLNLSALSFLMLPLLNIVVPLLLWRARRHEVAHAAEVGRRVLGFQILWQVSSTVAYLVLVLVHWVAAKYFQTKLPGTFLGVFIVSYLLNVLMICYEALRLRRGKLDIYRFRL